MFKKILIANRGEIACRVIATARRLGVRTVAVHSDVDAAAKHVAMADEAALIGGAAAAESYLRADRVIAAALASGAEAIHPGYGFLSENAGFVEAVEAAGLVFIGPPAEAIRAMGLKDAAKARMQQAGVPVVPGYHGDSQDPALLAAEAEKIGYPVLIKARAGGGGKGMRLVDKPAEFEAALQSARREAEASFGDPACLVEKFILSPRHIEIQVFADAHGNVVHLFERDCSLQRRHQKVIEEAPAPGMTEPVRQAMGAAAVEAARAIGYQGAGTVEFIVDGSGRPRADGFWFMEMNTRLQVEHPVTEAITGQDLVELQLRVASGEPLPFAQEDLTIDGWAIEARVYAEDAASGFLPATGVLEHLRFPEAAAAFERAPVRIDSGVSRGDEISPWYDPMIAKVIAHGATRAEALSRLSAALAESEVLGCTANLSFLSALARHEGFARGDVDTGLIGRDLEALTATLDPSEAVIALASVAALGLLDAEPGSDPWARQTGWRQWGEAEQTVELTFGEQRLSRRVAMLGGDRYRVEADESGAIDLMARSGPGGATALTIDGARKRLRIARPAGRIAIFEDGETFVFHQVDPLSRGDDAGGGGDAVLAPMPGMVKAVFAEVGQTVDQGQALLALEAMKMEHTLGAPRGGVVAEILASQGEQVANGALLLRLEPEES